MSVVSGVPRAGDCSGNGMRVLTREVPMDEEPTLCSSCHQWLRCWRTGECLSANGAPTTAPTATAGR